MTVMVIWSGDVFNTVTNEYMYSFALQSNSVKCT